MRHGRAAQAGAPGLTISTIGFKTDGPAAEQLSCIARATRGLFVGAANADQLATRLIAVQNVGEAKKSRQPMESTTSGLASRVTIFVRRTTIFPTSIVQAR